MPEGRCLHVTAWCKAQGRPWNAEKPWSEGQASAWSGPRLYTPLMLDVQWSISSAPKNKET